MARRWVRLAIGARCASALASHRQAARARGATRRADAARTPTGLHGADEKTLLGSLAPSESGRGAELAARKWWLHCARATHIHGAYWVGCCRALSCVRVPSYPVPQHDARWLRRELRLPGPHEGLRPLRLHRSPRAVGAHPPRCGLHRRLLRQLVPLHVVRAPRASAGPVDAICFCVCHFLFCVRVCLR